LRENLKSRPDFAKDLQPYKEDLRNFYRQEEELRYFLPDYEGYDSKQLSKMTHMEPFTGRIWNPQAQKKATVYVLFDYRNRSPLTGEARTVFVQKNEVGKFEENNSW